MIGDTVGMGFQFPCNETLREHMDDPACDPTRLERTYAQFGILNDLLSGWKRSWATTLRPALRSAAQRHGTASLLDVGFGGGDLARRLAAWAARDAVSLDIVAIDPDPRALAYARSRATPPNVRYLQTTTHQLVAQGERYDAVVSNHVLHHLSSEEVRSFLAETDALATSVAVHGDLYRTRLAVPAFALFSLPFRRSFVREDGQRSIRRAWTSDEIAPFVPPGMRVRRDGGFRISIERVPPEGIDR